jgi:hypothetical protein
MTAFVRHGHVRRLHAAALSLLAIFTVGIIAGCSSDGSDSNPAVAENEENTLLVWAGDQAHVAPDFIAVVDFAHDSPDYGRVLRTVPLSGASAIGNEPHHVGLSHDGRTLALGGLLSLLRGQDQVFFFDVADPGHPAGTMEVQLIPRDRRLRAFTVGMADDNLHLVDTQGGSAEAVFSFAQFAILNTHVMPQLLRINKRGTRLFVTLNYGGAAGKVVMLDITRPDQPTLLSVVDLGPDSGPHYLRLTVTRNVSW